MSRNRNQNAVLAVETNFEEQTETSTAIEATAGATSSTEAAAETGAAETKEGLSAEELIQKYGNKSKAIRALAQEGHKCGPISKMLNIRYQHARNVLNQPLKREIKSEREASKIEQPKTE